MYKTQLHTKSNKDNIKKKSQTSTANSMKNRNNEQYEDN